eukprot:129068-Amphidinium_carterae.1
MILCVVVVVLPLSDSDLKVSPLATSAFRDVTASLTATTHSRLLNCNAKANDATVLKPKLGKLA